MNIFTHSIKSKIRNFHKDESGNFAVIFVVCLFMLTLVIGAATDYSRMSRDRSKFQGILDSATLNAAISLRKKQWEQAKQDGVDHFSAQIPLNMETDIVSVDFTYVDDIITGKLKSKSENYFMGLVGINKIDYEVEAAVYFPDYPIEVAMVLDTTFSMTADNKIDTLKTAAKDFVETVLANSTGDRKISIVPFAQYVNVGRDKMGENWLDAEDQVVQVPQQCHTTTPIVSKSGCTTQTTNHPATNVPEQCSPASYNDGVQTSPPTCTPAYTQPAYTSSYETCTNIVYGDPVTTCQPAYSYTIYWNGCVASRNYPLNLQDKDFSFKVPGPNGLLCPSEITPLTSNKSALKSAIDALIPVGNTYIPHGMAWGTRTLSKMAPYNEAKADGEMTAKKGRRYLMLMTDGVNVVSPQIPASPLHNGSDIDLANDYLTETCTNAKNSNIEVFTVSFGTGVDEDTQDLLRDCASQEDYYFHAGTSTEFKESFKAIADLIVTLHLSM